MGRKVEIGGILNSQDASVSARPLAGFLTVGGVNGYPVGLYNRPFLSLGPRFGFAYKIGEKLVMRGGWGRYYLNPSNSYIQSTGFSTSTPLVSSLDGGRTPISNLINNPFPSGLLLPPGSSAGPLTR